jgi:hypothetical protein
MLEFKSSEKGATIRFSVVTRYEDCTEFCVEVKCPFGSASVQSSTMHYGSPGTMFQSMAKEWRGWDGEKAWADLEDSFSLKATSDSLGHTQLTVTLSDYESSFKTVLIFEAGQLEAMANAINELLP